MKFNLLLFEFCLFFIIYFIANSLLDNVECILLVFQGCSVIRSIGTQQQRNCLLTLSVGYFSRTLNIFSFSLSNIFLVFILWSSCTKKFKKTKKAE